MTKPNAKPCILALETSGALLSVSVWHEGKIASLISNDIKHGHAKDIVPTAMAALQQAGCGFEMVTHVAAGVGPGSFTGIRVALACAKGFCLAWGAQGISVSGLQALASNAAQKGHNDGAPMLITADTRRGSLYGQFLMQMVRHQARFLMLPHLNCPPDGSPCGKRWKMGVIRRMRICRYL